MKQVQLKVPGNGGLLFLAQSIACTLASWGPAVKWPLAGSLPGCWGRGGEKPGHKGGVLSWQGGTQTFSVPTPISLSGFFLLAHLLGAGGAGHQENPPTPLELTGRYIRQPRAAQNPAQMGAEW
jgi:hypothetical protein